MRPTICRECFTIMEGSAWPLCEKCTDARVTQAVATPLDIPVLWDDVPELPKYESSDDVPTVPTGTPPPLSALAPPKPVCGKCLTAHAGPCQSRQYPWPESVSEAAKKPKRVPTMEERAAWFHHNQTSVGEQVGPGPKPSLFTRLWARICCWAEQVDEMLLRLL